MPVLYRKSLLMVCVLALAGCGGGGGGGGGSSSSSAVPLSGSAVKGPLINAVAEVFEIDPTAADLKASNTPIDTGSTGSNAELQGISLDPANAPYLLVITADDDTRDITTGQAPVITTLRTIITADMLTNGTPIYATPLTSMAVDVVSSQTDTTAVNLDAQLSSAQNQVKTTLGFGMDETIDIFTTPPILTDETDTTAEQEATAEYRLAIEALSAVVVDIAESTTDSEDSAADVLTALAEDLADGELDGETDGEVVSELDGYDVSTLDDVNLGDLMIPGTDTSIDDIETVLTNDTQTTGTSETLDDTIDVSAEPPVLVADADLDGFGDDVDNCPLNANITQSDTNQNGVGDACDAAPVIAADLTATVNEDSSVVVDLSQGVTDAEGDNLVYIVGESQLEGSSYLYEPPANQNGEFAIDYSVSDGTSETIGLLVVTVTPQNDPGSVSISGDATQGQTLTAMVLEAFDGLVNAVISFIWSDDSGVIEGETESTLVLTQDQVGETITVSASYTDDEGFQETVESEATQVVVNVNDLPQGIVSIVGSPVVGESISASNTLSDADGLGNISYEWFLDGVTTSVEGSTYTVELADVGGDITVVASYVDGFGEQESVESNAVTALAEPVEFDSSLVGSWDLNVEEFGAYDKTIISFTATGEFFFFNVNSDDTDNCRSTGYEYGTYERVGNNINLTRIIDTDGCVGLFDATENQSEAVFTITDEETTKLETTITDSLQITFESTWTRIQTNSDSIVGSWHEVFEGQQGNVSNLLIFLGDGRMYAMDADPSDTQENDFFYGDYTYEGSAFTRTWVFQGFSDTAFAQNNDTQIVDNRLVFNVDDSLGRNVPDLQNADAPLAFSETELDVGFTWYFVGPYDGDCASNWLVEEMTFDANGYSLDVCGLDNGQEVNEAYQVLPSGVVRLVSFDEYIRRLSFDPETQSYTICYAASEQAALDCAIETQALAFINAADAQAYVDVRLGGFSGLTAGTYNSQVSGDDLPTVFVLSGDGTGTWSYGDNESGSITWSVESNGTLLIGFDGGGSEIYTLTSGTVESGSVEIDFSNEPTATATWERVDEGLVGAWRLDVDTEGQEVYNQIYLTLLDTGEFFFIENGATDQNCREVGYEYGTYQVSNDRIELDVTFDSNGCIGLVDSTVPETEETLFIVNQDSSNALTFSLADEEGVIDMTRVVPPVHSIVGLYHEPFEDSVNNQGGNDLSQILLFTGANTFFITDYDRINTQVNDFSYGTYTFDGSAGELTLDFIFATADADNNTGDVITLSGVVLSEDSFTFNEGEGTTTLPRQGPVVDSSDPNIAIELTATVTAYQQGELRTANGGSATMQCDIDGSPSVNDVELYADWWQRSGSTITITNMEFPDEPYTAAFDTQLLEVDFADQEVEEDPTGEQGDIFTNTFEVTGTATWDASEQAFIGSVVEVTTLEWSINQETSVCTTSYDIRAQYQSGDLSTFLGQ